MNPSLRSLSFFAASLLLPSAALAELPPLSVSAGYASEVMTSRQYDLVDDDDNLDGYRVAAALTVGVPRGLLDVELGFQSSASAQTVHAALVSSLWLRSAQLGLRYRVPLFEHLHPYAQLGAGWDWATLRLADTTPLAQTVGHVSGTGLLGVQVPIKIRTLGSRQPHLMLDFGLGYTLRPGFSFSALVPEREGEPPPDAIGRGALNLGTMPMSSISARLLVSLRF